MEPKLECNEDDQGQFLSMLQLCPISATKQGQEPYTDKRITIQPSGDAASASSKAPVLMEPKRSSQAKPDRGQRKARNQNQKENKNTEEHLSPDEQKNLRKGFGNGLFLVDDVIDKIIDTDGKPLYLVKWKGFSKYENTWEPEEHLTPGSIASYEKKIKQKISDAEYERAVERAKAARDKYNKDNTFGQNNTSDQNHRNMSSGKCSAAPISSVTVATENTNSEKMINQTEVEKQPQLSTEMDAATLPLFKEPLPPSGTQVLKKPLPGLPVKNGTTERPMPKLDSKGFVVLETEKNLVGQQLDKIMGAFPYCGDMFYVVSLRGQPNSSIVASEEMITFYPLETIGFFESSINWINQD